VALPSTWDSGDDVSSLGEEIGRVLQKLPNGRDLEAILGILEPTFDPPCQKFADRRAHTRTARRRGIFGLASTGTVLSLCPVSSTFVPHYAHDGGSLGTAK
jgi:hypothetical protein